MLAVLDAEEGLGATLGRELDHLGAGGRAAAIRGNRLSNTTSITHDFLRSCEDYSKS